MSFFSGGSVNTQAGVHNLDMAAIMRLVYTWMTFGLIVTFGTALLIANTGLATVFLNPVMIIVSFIAYIILAFALQPIIMRASVNVGTIAYLVFTAVFGVMIAGIFIVYAPGAILAAFVATAGMFGAMTVYGYTTKADLSRFGSILLMALIGIILASLVNLFLRSEAIYWIVTYASVLIFAGLTAYDTQWIKNNAAQIAQTGNNDNAIRLALVGAFHLYLDFMNLFLTLLRIFGASRD